MKIEGMELSVTEQFVLLKVANSNLEKSKKIKFADRNIITIISIMVEFILKNKVYINKNKEVILKDSKLTGLEYEDEVLKILQSKKERKIEKWIDYFTIHSNLTVKIFDSVVKSIVKKNAINIELNSKKYIDNKDISTYLIKKIKTEFLEEAQVNEEIMYLATLLETDRSLEIYFSKDEYKCIKDKMREINEKVDNNVLKMIPEIVKGIKVSSIIELFFNIISSI